MASRLEKSAKKPCLMETRMGTVGAGFREEPAGRMAGLIRLKFSL